MPSRTMLGQPVVKCGDFTAHDWHSDGRTYCPGHADLRGLCPSSVPHHGGHVWDTGRGLMWCTGERLTPAELEAAVAEVRRLGQGAPRPTIDGPGLEADAAAEREQRRRDHYADGTPL